MKKYLILMVLVALFVSMQAKKLPEKNDVLTIMTKVADWQCAQKPSHYVSDWVNGALYTGMMEYAKIAPSDKYFDWLKQRGDEAKWSLIKRRKHEFYHADDIAVGMMYCEMYRIEKNSLLIEDLKARLELIIAEPSHVTLDFSKHRLESPAQRWSWCDALFMAPTSFAKMYQITGEVKYLHFMFKEYKATTDYLYDHKEHLYYRDSNYFGNKEPNGQPVFWGRGNGWVFGGLPIILEELPERYCEKMWFEKMYVDMAKRIAGLQDDDGYWHASMLDHKAYPNPETSCSGFFVYGLAWGINNGYLDRETYLPIVLKGWEALTDAVYPNGKLGWVQPIGESPVSTTKDMTELYGVGSFLLAGTEILKLAK